MKRNKLLFILVPVMIGLCALATYEYGYLKIEEEISSIRDEEEIKKKTLDKYVALIAEKPELEQKLSGFTEQRKASESKLIHGETQALAAAQLQEIVKGIITSRGGTISSERVGKVEEMGKFKVISVSIDTVLPDTRVLGDVLYSIETRTPHLLVKELDARVRNFREPKDLMVKFDVFALYGGK